MFIRLQYTSNKNINTIFRTVADIVNNSSINSIQALRTRANVAPYDASILSGLDDSNSEIIRTIDPSLVLAHAYKPANATHYKITFRFPVHDGSATFTGSIAGTTLTVTSVNSGVISIGQELISNGITAGTRIIAQLSGRGGVGTYLVSTSQTVSSQTISTQRVYYLQFSNASTQVGMNFNIGDSITGGTMASSQLLMSVAENSSIGGTDLVLGNGYALSPVIISSANAASSTAVRTFWMYITNKGMIWSTTNSTTYSTGWGPTYNDGSLQSGPWIFGQYTRYDHFNTMDNGVIPVMYTVPRYSGQGFGLRTDYTVMRNPSYSDDNSIIPFKIYNMIDALPQLGSSWPLVYSPNVAYTIAGMSNGNTILNLRNPLSASSGINTQYGKAVATVAGERYPSANLATTGFSISPLGWECLYRGNHGGNVSDQTGFYIFNGDYQPGDTFGLNNKTWMVWPVFHGSSDRIGIAVPKE
jgi:hypothetical protein